MTILQIRMSPCHVEHVCRPRNVQLHPTAHTSSSCVIRTFQNVAITPNDLQSVTCHPELRFGCRMSDIRLFGKSSSARRVNKTTASDCAAVGGGSQRLLMMSQNTSRERLDPHGVRQRKPPDKRTQQSERRSNIID